MYLQGANKAIQNAKKMIDIEKYIEYLLGLGETHLEFVKGLLKRHLHQKKINHQQQKKTLVDCYNLIGNIKDQFSYEYRTKIKLKPLHCVLIYMRLLLHHIEALQPDNQLIQHCQTILNSLEQIESKG